MSETLQLEPAIDVQDGPKLLVEWSSPWEEFVTSIRPAFGRSGERLAGETPYGVFPYRGLLAAWVLEAFLLFVIIVLPGHIARILPYSPPKVRPYEVVYYSGDELPRTEDLGGAQSGVTGRAGGREAHHRTQTIRVARGSSLAQKVVDAPNLKLPTSMDAVANLLAMKPVPGPPPAEGLHAALTLPNLPANVVAPAPANVARDHSRRGVTLDSVVPPAPNVSRDKPLTAPTLNSAVVPPAPSLSREHTLVAPALNSSVIAPAPAVSRGNPRSVPALNGSVIPPAPGAVSREVARSPVQMNNVAVVPPPVSSPERETTLNAKLTLPAPSVIAPPPSTDATRDLRRLASGSVAEPSNTVVPPPPTQSGSGSFVSSIMGKLFGTQDVVPPPPAAPSGSTNGTGRNANGSGSTIGANVVPPPPAVGASGAAAGSSSGTNRGGSLSSNVIPPPPSAAGSGTGRGAGGATGNAGNAGGTLLASNVVPPPPSFGSGSAAGGNGSGRQGTGLGGVGDVGSVLAPPSGGGGSGGGSGVVVSNQPGSQVGIPGGGKGSLAMSPAGGDQPGLGGAGEGSGIGHGDGTGSGMTGEGSGAGKTGAGRGSDLDARGGISLTPGPGGAGNATSGIPAVPGVSISGGSTEVVNLPSFGGGDSNDPNLPGRSSVKGQQGPAITIVASSRSGGAFNFYGLLKGDRVYTIYFSTSAGQTVMQYADPTSAAHPYAEALLGPKQMRTDLPPGLMNSHMVISCTLDTSGKLKDITVLERGPASFTAKVLAALPTWKFRPAMRGKQPVEVTAILGFGINTNDRN